MKIQIELLSRTGNAEFLFLLFFLGIDHGFRLFTNSSQRPILFESMVFGKGDEQYQERYCTYYEALNGHRRIVHQLDLGVLSNKWFEYIFLKFKNLFVKK